MTRRLRYALLGIFLACLGITLTVTLWPYPLETPLLHLILDLVESTKTISFPPRVVIGVIDISANVVLFLPLGALLAALLRRSLWWCGPAFALVLSVLIELTQFIALPDRTGTILDVVSNTCGALIGALLVLVIRSARVHARRRTAQFARARSGLTKELPIPGA
jgi:glycopeptide antibiotics resistance protein